MENGNEDLTAEEILRMDDIPMECVTVPEWNNRKVWVCGMSGAGKNAWQASLMEIQGKNRKIKMDNATAKLLQRTLCDAKRQLLFTEAQIVKLGTKSSAVLERLAKVASRLSGMDEEENEALLKNSEAAQSDDSLTVSL